MRHKGKIGSGFSANRHGILGSYIYKDWNGEGQCRRSAVIKQLVTLSESYTVSFIPEGKSIFAYMDALMNEQI